jgi:predicted enzyme involved in methoxymalonyl-ACP biosynthesis
MEDFIFLKIWNIAKERGCARLEGIFRPTQKNGVVATLYDRLGGNSVYITEKECRWQFNLAVDIPRLTHFIADECGTI